MIKLKSKRHKAIVLLDTFFTSEDAFEAVKHINDGLGMDGITLITRAKANTVAFEEPEVAKKRGRGQPRKYGKQETVQYLCMFLFVTCNGKIRLQYIGGINLKGKKPLG